MSRRRARPRAARWLALLAALLPLHPAGAIETDDTAAGDDRPAIVRDIEDRFDGRFIFVTDGGGSYGVYELLENRRGLSDRDEVVCLIRQCYVAIAEVPAAAVARWSADRAALERLRTRFRSVRDAYDQVQRAGGDALPDAARRWQASAARAGACLEDERAC